MEKVCEICTAVSHKYKCPKCEIKYCSVKCYKQHKDSICKIDESSAAQRSTEPPRVPLDKEDGELSDCEMDDFTDDKVHRQFLDKLGESEEIRMLLGNPHLRVMMTSLTEAEDPGKLMESAMKEPIFTEFADECLKIVQQDKT